MLKLRQNIVALNVVRFYYIMFYHILFCYCTAPFTLVLGVKLCSCMHTGQYDALARETHVVSKQQKALQNAVMQTYSIT